MDDNRREVRACTQRMVVWIGALVFFVFTASVGYRVWQREAVTGIVSVKHGVTYARLTDPAVFASAHGGTGFETALALIFALGFLAATFFEIGHRRHLRMHA